MAYLNLPDDDYDDDEDASAPYDSVASRPPIAPVAPEPVSQAPDPVVKQYLQQKLSTPKNPSLEEDPFLKQYLKDRSSLDDYQQAKVKADTQSNLAQSFAQLAQGSSTPKDNGVFNKIASQNQDILTGKEQDLGRRQKVMDAIEGRKSREGIAKDNRDARTDAMKVHSDDLKLKTQQAADAKMEIQSGKWATALKDDLDPNKARGGNMASNQKRVDNADRVQALLEQVHNNPDPRQMEELAISTQALLSASGTPAAEQVKALIPKTALGDANKFKEWLTNNPTGTGQQEFVKRMAETVQREKDIAQGQVQKAQRARLSAHGKLKDADPDTFNSIINAYGLGDEPKPSGMSAEAEKNAAAAFPKQIKKDGQIATVSNQKELDEAKAEGWM